jgi:hypothetical protein
MGLNIEEDEMEAEPRALDPEEEWRGEDTMMSDPRFDVLSTSSSIAVTSRAGAVLESVPALEV